MVRQLANISIWIMEIRTIIFLILELCVQAMMAWGVPPPPPPRPATLASLSTAELLRMEGTERRNIEARLQVMEHLVIIILTCFYEALHACFALYIACQIWLNV